MIKLFRYLYKSKTMHLINKLLISLTAIFFIQIPNFGQSYVPVLETTDWFVRVSGFTGVKYEWYHFSGDSVYNNKTYKKVVLDTVDHVFYLVREDTTQKKVYIIGSGQLNEKVLYDFSLPVGQTMPLYNSPNIQLTLQSIGTVNTMLGIRKQYVFTANPSGFTINVIEGVGSTWHPFLLMLLIADPAYDVICNYERDQQVYQSIIDTCPTRLTVDVPILKSENRIIVYPNPARDHIQISVKGKLNEMTYSIYSITGKVMDTGMIDGSGDINTQKWPNGIYFLIIDREIHKIAVEN